MRTISTFILPMLAMAIIVMQATRIRNSIKSGNGTYHGILFFAFTILVFSFGYLTRNNVSGDYNLMPIIITQASGVMSMAIMATRLPVERGLEAQDDNSTPHSHIEKCLEVAAIISFIILTASLCILYIELPYNTDIDAIDVGYLSNSFYIVFAILACVIVVSRGSLAPIAIICSALFAFGIANQLVIEFRGTPIMVTDLLSIGTATNVADSYNIHLNTLSSVSASLLCFNLVIMFFMHPICKSSYDWIMSGLAKKVPAANILIAASAIAVSMLSTSICASNIIWMFEEEQIDYWDMSLIYKEHGILPSMIKTLSDMEISPPTWYSESKAKELMSEYAKENRCLSPQPEAASQRKPNIIVIMNETYVDMSSAFPGMIEGYVGRRYLDENKEGFISGGNLGVSVLGGGTCNTEFEFLTGYSSAGFGLGKYPYQMYRMGNVRSIVKLLENSGYSTTAVHPENKGNWTRDVVYEELGFDDFLSIDDFNDSERVYFHNGVSDFSTYKKILDTIDDSESPEFIFAVTMQNHGGYGSNNIPDDILADYDARGLDEYQLSEMNEYLSCIEESDRAISWLLSEISKSDTPTLVLFFGDHQPGFSIDFNRAWYADSDSSIESMERIYQSSWFLWSNYSDGVKPEHDLREDTRMNMLMSPTFLSSYLIHEANVEDDDFGYAQMAIHDSMDCVNAYGYHDASGWHRISEADDGTPIGDFLSISYYQFGSRL